MKKLLLITVVGMCAAGCSSAVQNDYSWGDVINKNLLHSVFSKDTKEEANDSLKSESNTHFNFFLKEGFAKKFGL